MENLWNWEKCKDKILRLNGRLGFPKTPILKFLGLSLSLKDGLLYDDLRDYVISPEDVRERFSLWSIYHILSSYSEAEEIPPDSKLVTSKQLTGGQFCYVSIERAKANIKRVFGRRPASKMFLNSAKILGGSKGDLGHGDYSVKINALPLIPITIILYEEDSEFPPDAQIFFNKSVSHYLDLEQTGILVELTVERLKEAYKVISEKKESLLRFLKINY